MWLLVYIAAVILIGFGLGIWAHLNRGAKPESGLPFFKNGKTSMEISRQQVEEQRDRRFGNANPEPHQVPFWEWMVRDGGGPFKIRQELGFEIFDGKGPIWCFNRMGATRTELPDGRTVCIGGEHEDYYDPDFCIYNDVVVLGPNGQVKVYGYPKSIFPPTDFHSATLVGNRIILIGCLGYPEDRIQGRVPVFSLDLATYRMDRIETIGEGPGWISEHSAEFDKDKAIVTVRSGQHLETLGGRERIRKNVEEYDLRITNGRWQRLTDRNEWRQFLIGRQDRDV
jgi:hypothetical protein